MSDGEAVSLAVLGKDLRLSRLEFGVNRNIVITFEGPCCSGLPK